MNFTVCACHPGLFCSIACRSTYPRGGAVCSVHPEREASLQCMVCLRCKVPTHLSYHCSVECLKSHWNLHKDYHKQQPAPQVNGEEPRLAAGMKRLVSVRLCNIGSVFLLFISLVH